MSTYSLADIKAAADKAYGHTVIDLGDGQSTTLLNPVRMSDDRRAELVSMQGRISEEGVNQREVLCDLLRLVAETEGQADRLLALIGHDLALLMSTFDKWNGEDEAGEA